MKHQPAGSGDGCAVYTMRQWVQASGNRPGLAPERERQELRPAQLTPGDNWLLGFSCTGMFWRKGYSTEYSGSAPLTFFFEVHSLRIHHPAVSPQKCVPYSIFTARLLTRTSSSISTAQLCLGTPTWRVLKLQTSCVTWPLPEGVYSPAALRGPFPRVPSEQSSCLIYDLA